MDLDVRVGAVEGVLALVMPVDLHQLPGGVEGVGAVDCKGELGGAAGGEVDLGAVVVGVSNVDDGTRGPVDLHCALWQRGQTCSSTRAIGYGLGFTG